MATNYRLGVDLPWKLLPLVMLFRLVKWILLLPLRPWLKARRERKLEEQAQADAIRTERANAHARGEDYEPPAGHHAPSKPRWARRHRKALAPVLVAAGLAASLPPLAAGSARGIALVLAGWAVMALLWVRWVRPQNRLHAAGALGAAVCWWAGTLHLTWRLGLGTLVGGALVVAVVRAYHFRIRPVIPVEEPEPELTASDVWNLKIGAERKRLAGSVVLEEAPVIAPDGHYSGVKLTVTSDDEHDYDSAAYRAQRSRIAVVYRVGIHQVVVEPEPTNEGVSYVSVLLGEGGNPLHEAQLFTGPDLDAETGCFTMAMSLDRSPGIIQLFDQTEGARMGWVNGATGVGKSTAFDTLLANATAPVMRNAAGEMSGVVVPIVIDCKGGASLADWEGVPNLIHLSVDPDDPEQVAAAVGLIYGINCAGRARLGILRGTTLVNGRDMGVILGPDGEVLARRKALPVTPELPMLLPLIEEAPRLFAAAREAVPDVEKTTTQYRASQIGVWFASQETILGANRPGAPVGAFAGNGTIRKQVRAGNVVILRNSRDAGGQAAESAIDVDPSMLPPLGGMAYLMSPHDRRDIMRRVLHVQHGSVWARRACVPPLDAITAAALAMRPPKPEEKQPAGSSSGANPVHERVWAFVVAQGEVRRGEIDRAFGDLNADQLEYALRKGRDAGRIHSPSKGVWAAVMATNGSAA